jgi:hypothetical protein
MSTTAGSRLVTLKSFPNAIEAHLVKIQLEDAGIQSFVFDEHISTMNPLYNQAVGGVKVKVASDDRDAALNIIQFDSTVHETEVSRHTACPHCKSSDVQSGFTAIRSFRALLAFVYALTTFTVPLFLDRYKRCLECDKLFTDSSEKAG